MARRIWTAFQRVVTKYEIKHHRAWSYEMNTKETFMKFGIDFLSAILLGSIVAFLTPFVIGQGSNLNYIFVYVWVTSLVLFAESSMEA
jgi:hypothetical protein